MAARLASKTAAAPTSLPTFARGCCCGLARSTTASRAVLIELGRPDQGNCYKKDGPISQRKVKPGRHQDNQRRNNRMDPCIALSPDHIDPTMKGMAE